MSSASNLFDRLECPHCGSEIDHGRCLKCLAQFKPALGVPFFGQYEKADILGLIEISANAPNRSQLRMSQEFIKETENLCAEFEEASDKELFLNNLPLKGMSAWLPSRHQEWRAFRRLTAGLELKGKRVLDIGAGQGYDSFRLHLLGADVTAIEFSPILLAAASESFPEIKWAGGFSHALPFKTGTFDAVFCNAALHHMRDIPTSIAEALRVLKPGGVFISTGDPFKPNHMADEHEFEIFDRHPAVLLGINEQVPRFGDLVKTLRNNKEILNTEIFTTVLYGGICGEGKTETDIAQWNLDADGETLDQRYGSLALRVELLKEWPHERNYQKNGVLDAALFADWLDDQSVAVSQLAQFIDESELNRAFPGPQTKIDLINGWRTNSKRSSERIGYRRARWFLKRISSKSVEFEIKSNAQTKFEFLLNGTIVKSAVVGAHWQKISIDLESINELSAFVLEIRRIEDAGDFDLNCFRVRKRRMRPGSTSIARSAVGLIWRRLNRVPGP